MSITFRPLTPIWMQASFDGRLQDLGVHEHHSKEATANARCLTDGESFLWVYDNEFGLVSRFIRYPPSGSSRRIREAIGEAFGINIVSEYEPEFWGYASEEEWDAAWLGVR